MLRFFNKNISLEKLEELLQEGKGLTSKAVIHAARKQFDLIGKSGDLFYEKLKHKGNQEAAFNHALQQLPDRLLSSSKKAIHSLEYLWDEEIIRSLQSDDDILLRWTTNYLVHRFYKIKEEVRFRKYRFEETTSRSVFNDALDQFIRRVANGDFEKKSTLKTFFSTILHNEHVNEIRRRETKKRLGDKYTIWDEDAGMIDNLIYSKGKIKNELSKIDYDHLMKILNIFEQQNRKCYDLITTSIMNEVSLPVLAERQGITRNNITVQRFKCMKALRVFWKNNQNV